MATEVVMPQMGESIAEGTITKWLKKVGDRVERDEPLFEISTDKVDAEIPSPAAGTLTEILFNEGDTGEVNKPVAVLDGAGAGTASQTNAQAPAAAEATAPPKEEQPAQAEAPPPPAAQPQPDGKTATPSPEASKTATAPSQQQSQPPAPPAKTTAEPARADKQAGDNGHAATAEDLRRTKSSPLVRKIAQEHGVDIGRLEGTGMSGRVTKNDILSFIESGAPAAPARAASAPAPGRVEEIPAAPPKIGRASCRERV